MKTEYEKKAVIKLPKNSNAFAIDTPDHLPKLHGICIANGKRGSGKSIAITNLIRMYKEELGSDLRVIVVSPTFGSNYKLLSELGINREDVFEEPDDDVPAKLIKIANDERDAFLEWKHLNEYYNQFIKTIKGGVFDRSNMDEYMLQYYNPLKDRFERPKPKYPCYLKGKPPVVFTFFDDNQGSTLLSTNKKMLQLCLRHRHLGQMPPPQGGAVGMSLFVSTQTFKSQGGLNKAIRSNCTALICFKTQNMSELQQISEAFSGEIPVDRFFELYKQATEKPHDFLFVDLHYKKDVQPSGFRQNFDTYLIPDEKQSDESETSN
jgi:hypothetical protein